ncbi:hypothetical protein NL676_035781 [Syzygium grande]|nr:hypothetical protein NL676_035781 [Syzygium grande]
MGLPIRDFSEPPVGPPTGDRCRLDGVAAREPSDPGGRLGAGPGRPIPRRRTSGDGKQWLRPRSRSPSP